MMYDSRTFVTDDCDFITFMTDDSYTYTDDLYSYTLYSNFKTSRTAKHQKMDNTSPDPTTNNMDTASPNPNTSINVDKDKPLPKNTSIQIYNMDTIHRLLATMPHHHPDRAALKHIEQTSTDGQIRVRAKFAKGSTIGRMYNAVGMQRMTKDTINQLSNGDWIELDIYNSFPSIIHWLVVSRGGSCPFLERIVLHREEVLKDLMDESLCSRLEAKAMILKVIFLGGTKRSGSDVIQGSDSGFLRLLSTEMTTSAANLCGDRQDVVDWAIKRNEAKGKPNKNPIATALSFIIGDHERLVMDIVKHVIAKNGYTHQCDKFDSVIVSRVGCLVIPPELIVAIQDAVRSQYKGLNIEFNQTRLVYTQPIHTPTIVEPDTRLILFQFIVLAANGHQVDPAIRDLLKTINCDPRKRVGVMSPFSLSYTNRWFESHYEFKPSCIITSGPTVDLNDHFVMTDDVLYVCIDLNAVHKTSRSRSIQWSTNNANHVRQEVFAAAKTDMFTGYPNRITINKEDLILNKSNGKLVLPENNDLQLDVKLELYVASMGLGKSYQGIHRVKLIFEMLRASGITRPRILIVAARIQQSHHMMKLFKDNGFDPRLYSDIDGKQINDCDECVFQYESICRLRTVEPFHIIFCDEIRADLGQVPSSKTNKMLSMTDKVFASLCHSATKVLCYDADLLTDSLVRDYFATIFTPEQTLITECTYNQIKRHVSKHESYETMLGEIQTALNANEKCAYIFRTKSELISIQDYIKRFAPHRRIQAFYGKSDERILKECYANPDEFLLIIDDLLANSKVTVGSDVSIPIDKIFIFGGFAGSTARDVSQGAGRYRAGFKVHLYMPLGQFEGEVCTFEEAQRLVEIDETTRETHINAINAADLVHGTRKLDMKSRVMIALCHSIAENRSCFNTKLLSIFHRAGYEIVPYQLPDDEQAASILQSVTSQATTDIKISNASCSEYVLFKDAITHFVSIPLDVKDVDCNEFNDKKSDRSIEDNYRLDVFVNVLRHFTRESLPVVPVSVFMKLAMNNQTMKTVLRYHLTTLTGPHLFNNDVKHMATAQLPSSQSINFASVQSFNSAIATIGLTHSNDFDTIIPIVETSMEQKKTLQRHLDDIKSFRGKSTKPTKHSYKQTIVDILRLFGRDVVSKRIGSASNKTQKTVYSMRLMSIGDTCISEIAKHLRKNVLEVTPDIYVKPASKRQKVK